MICEFCSFVHNDGDNFCPRCGKSPEKKAPYSDFELGRIAALDTMKTEFISWFVRPAAIITILLAVLAYFGVNEMVKNRVSDGIKDTIQSIQKTIEDASSKALQSAAKAEIETNQVEVKLSQLNSAVTDAEKQKDDLEKSLTELSTARQGLLTTASDLQQREASLKKVIDTQNLATIFAQLRNDHYRVRTLRARVLIDYIQQPPGNPVVAQYSLNTISLTKATPNKTPREESYVVQFVVSGQVVNLVLPASKATGALVQYEMYPVFERTLANYPMQNLDGIDKISLQFGPEGPSQQKSADQIISDLEKFTKLVKDLAVEIELNGTIIDQQIFLPQDLQLPSDKTGLMVGGVITFDFSRNIPGTYKDVKALYDSHAASMN